MKSVRHLLTTLIIITSLTGCMSLQSTFLGGINPSSGSKGPIPYSGAQASASYLYRPCDGTNIDSNWIATSLWVLLDLPLTIGMDTLLLPFTTLYVIDYYLNLK